MDYQKLEQAYQNHGFATHVCKTGAEAAEYMKSQVQGQTVGFGGSVTAKEIGLDRALAEKNMLLWHWATPTEGRSLLDMSQTADVYISSVNGASETGELVNIDGTGNRVAATIYGPKRVYFLVGKNKIRPDLAGAMERAKNIAAPLNAKRLGRKTPCAVKCDKCYDCNSPERICRATVILERPTNMQKVEVVFIDEDLGL